MIYQVVEIYYGAVPDFFPKMICLDGRIHWKSRTFTQFCHQVV